MNLENVYEQIQRDACLCYRVIMASQAASYFPDAKRPERQARRVLERLCQDGWMKCVSVMASLPLPEISKPLVARDPKQPTRVDAEKVSHEARTRWNQSTLQTVTVYYATNRSRKLYGVRSVKGDSSSTRWDQINHDLVSTEVCNFYRIHRPRYFPYLRCENVYERHYKGTKVSDMLLVKGTRYLEPFAALDSAGSYNSSQIASYVNFWGGGLAGKPKRSSIVTKPTYFELW